MQIPSCGNQQPMCKFSGLILTLVCHWANHSNLMCHCGQVFDSEIKKNASGSKHIVTLKGHRHARVIWCFVFCERKRA